MEEEIVFVTHNTGKIKSAEKYFKNLKFITFLPNKIQGIDREEKWMVLDFSNIEHTMHTKLLHKFGARTN